MVSPLRGSKRPRKRIDGTSFRIAGGAATLGWKTSVSMPFGMICQLALKYRSSATVVECDTQIAASSLSSRFWKYPLQQPVAVATGRSTCGTCRPPGTSASSIASSGRIGVSGECTCTMSYRPARSTLAHLAPQPEADRDARLGAVGVHRLAASEADDVRLRLGAGNVRRDDVDVMSAAARFAGEEVHVLADAAQVRIVVLGDERDAQRALVVSVREGGKIGKRRSALECSGTGRRRSRAAWSAGLVDRHSILEHETSSSPLA